MRRKKKISGRKMMAMLALIQSKRWLHWGEFREFRTVRVRPSNHQVKQIGLHQNLVPTRRPVLKCRANHRGLEVENHWGRVDQDAVIPADKIAELNLQATVYREERTDIPPCHAPLKKGGLCQRRDLRACPFHGPIVPRDDEGNPIIIDESQNQTSSSPGINQEDVSMDETTSDSDPNQLARQIAKQALKNIREKDREELRKIAKRAKHAKVKEHNFSVLRDAALASTSKSAVIDEEFDRVFAERKNKKQTFSLARRKKTTTAKDRISERLLSNRAKGTKPKQLPQGNDDEKYRETSANQW
ncbi:hypothetical protein Bca52824_082636 [Brassica carinata]|uniref:UV-stimulated scaffold protein A C-terminal domain-containing protein n=1 Tax=Brassica carinata TaxID=52824 RepID=A0A8X7PJI6_BRACI|nr:hypothetical protein Bca52824_082636 [Brassica carinata]